MSKPGEDIAVIKEQISQINKSIDEIKEMLSKITGRISEDENKIASITTKLDNFNLFQTVLTIIAGAIASFLGITQKIK